MITVYNGVMFSGKTERLILKFNELKDQGKKCLMIKPLIDKRFSSYEVVSRSGYRTLANMVISPSDISYLFDTIKTKKVDAIFFDEVQFLGEDLIYLVEDLHKANIDVYLAGLTRDSNDKPFGCLGRIMALNGVVSNRLNIPCQYPDCSKEAKVSFCKIDKQNTVLIGDSIYSPRCNSHLIKEGLDNE